MIYSYNGVKPETAPDVFLAPGALIVGDVHLSAGVNVWFYSVIRGDVHSVRVCDDTNIQDHCMLHVTGGRFPLYVGKGVVVGHRVVLHGCTIQDRALIGIGALVLDGAVVESEAIVAAGAVVPPGAVIPGGVVAAGVPAKPIRKASEEDHTYRDKTCREYREYAARFGDLVQPVF